MRDYFLKNDCPSSYKLEQSAAAMSFYSDWSPDIATYFIKVLGDPEDHNLELPDDKKEDFWKTGLVGKFSFRIGTANYKLPPAIKDAYESSDLDD